MRSRLANGTTLSVVSKLCPAIAMMVMLAACLPGAVTFESARPVPSTSPAAAPPSEPDTISGTLRKPQGEGPFPALVLLHGCGGGPLTSKAEWLTSLGYVTLEVDSFSRRGVRSVCKDPRGRRAEERRISLLTRVLDAYGGLKHLSILPYVDSDRIGLIGWSHGGMTAVLAINNRNEGHYWPKDASLRFGAVAAFYPNCWGVFEEGYRGYYAPLVILIGELDDWTSATGCKQAPDSVLAGGMPVEVHIFPDSYHAFDFRSKRRRYVEGHILEYNAAAATKAQHVVERFLDENL